MNWFDWLVIIIAGITFLVGFKSGLVMQLAGLVGLVLGAYFAGKLSEIIAPYLLALLPNNQHIAAPLLYLVAFVLILVGVVFLGKALQAMIVAAQLSFMNRVAGGFFATILWLFVLSILLNLLVELDQNKAIIKENVREQSFTYPYISKLSSVIIPYLRFDKLEEYKNSL